MYGGTSLSWIDEQTAIFAGCQMNTGRIVTKCISEINFTRSAKSGYVNEFGMQVVQVGRSTLTVVCMVRNKMTHEPIIKVDRVVFVALNAAGKPTLHGYTEKRATAA